MGSTKKQDICKYLHQYPTMPHTFTGCPAAEVYFDYKYNTRLPEKKETAHDPQIQQHDEEAKAQQKHYKDAKSNVWGHNI